MDAVQLSRGRIVAEVVIPLRWPTAALGSGQVEEMTRYLRGLAMTVTSVTVVDGSDPLAFDSHEAAWGPYVRVIRPDLEVRRLVRTASDDTARSIGLTRGRRLARTRIEGTRAPLNGKVIGALTGIREARHEHVVLADDDVRHTRGTITDLVGALEKSDLVRPVNVYDAWPWQARWDGARGLVNHALATDWPGTFALRRSPLLAGGGWCPDVLFENLELWRTVQAGGGQVLSRPQIRVPRRPPSATQFWSQRVRQAYDDFAQPPRLAVELAILPAALGLARSSPLAPLVVAAASVALAERGRRRLGADRVPPSVPLWAPVWVLERGMCVWIAVGSRLRGGVRYHGRRLRRAAHTTRQLQRVFADAPPDGQRAASGRRRDTGR